MTEACPSPLDQKLCLNSLPSMTWTSSAELIRSEFVVGVIDQPPTLPPSLKVVEDGYEFFAKRQLVTLFSAPNYCGEFDNAGAMMSVDETLMCSFQVCWVTSLHTWHDCGLDIPDSEASTG